MSKEFVKKEKGEKFKSVVYSGEGIPQKSLKHIKFLGWTKDLNHNGEYLTKKDISGLKDSVDDKTIHYLSCHGNKEQEHLHVTLYDKYQSFTTAFNEMQNILGKENFKTVHLLCCFSGLAVKDAANFLHEGQILITHTSELTTSLNGVELEANNSH